MIGELTRAIDFTRSIAVKEFFVTTSGSPVDLGVSTLPGIAVTEESALTYSSVHGAVKVISEDVAALPLPLYRRTANNGKEPARDHPLFTILHDLPNPEITSYELREMMMAMVLLWGNAYAEIERNPLGEIVALWPIHPHRVRIKREDLNSPLTYWITPPNGAPPKPLSKSRILHFRGLTLDGVTGISMIRQHRETIGLGMAAAEFGARFFSQGLNAGGTMEHPRTLSDEAYKRLKESMQVRDSGLEQSHRILILEEGMKFNKTSIPPEDAQWLQTRKFQVTEIARIYRIKPHKLADLEKATFSNIEEQSIEHVTDTLMPWLVRLEQAISRDLLSVSERKDLFAQFNVNGLLRGKTSERFAAYATARQWGWASVNDVLSLENRNGIGPAGDIYLSPMNMISAEAALRSIQEGADMELEQEEGVDADGRPKRRLTIRRRPDSAIAISAPLSAQAAMAAARGNGGAV